jgi:hypothetical protein
MTNTKSLSLTTLSTLLLALSACAVDDTSTTSRNINGGPGSGLKCEADNDCDPGLECEIEEEHGVTWSYCKPHGSDDGSGMACQSNADCATGLECEVSTSVCKPHGGV